MRFSVLDDNPLGYRKVELEAVFQSYIVRELEGSDPNWESIVRKRKLKIDLRYLRQNLIGWLPGQRRLEASIKKEYGLGWRETDLSSYDPAINKPPYNYWTWGHRRIVARVRGMSRVRLYLVARAIESLQPKRVLEVGCGNGINLLILAGMFPDIEFTGLELTREGISKARELQSGESLPQSLIDFAPFPIKDPGGFKKPIFDQGSAAHLPYEDRAFDFVFSCVAIEQMESIRHQALAEIGRVVDQDALFCEPFHDVNTTGTARRFVIARDYLRGPIGDLPKYGLEPIWATCDLPNKINFNVCAVLCRRPAAGDEKPI